ncbi:riboflavin kinase [Collinsella sp. An2]|uniref:bifunctional riboflavin kinase/FMN adenylyltransferase n=1 Tax=Collinsella sp. An2 TaxID=1965585 RepID=UPI000B37BADC|nr:riboflavin kinase [Collinsella sp. An2]OUP06976.1 riboflavin biosynthesis protein RibF [Collinsella sp. An2]
MMPSLEELRRDFLLAPACAPVYRLGTDDVRLGDAAIAIGVFDGLHVGHRELLRHTVEDARSRGIAAYAVTFDPDPDQVVSSHPARALMGTEDRIRALAASGVDGVLVVPFTRELAALDHARFFNEVLLPVCDVRAVHVGSDFRLGAHGASTVPIIAAWCADMGIAVAGHELVTDDGTPVSATSIRGYLDAADLPSVSRELGRRFMVSGHVHTGRGQGTSMGFPTADIRVDAGRQVPADGVYSGLALVDGVVWPAAINVGLPPMFQDKPNAASLEANLIGFSGDLYGRKIALAFDAFLRPSRTFPSVDELISTVLGNIQTVKDSFGERGVSIA